MYNRIHYTFKTNNSLTYSWLYTIIHRLQHFLAGVICEVATKSAQCKFCAQTDLVYLRTEKCYSADFAQRRSKRSIICIMSWMNHVLSYALQIFDFYIEVL